MSYRDDIPSNGSTDVDPEAERIVSEIEGTRYEMTATIDEIGHRLQPQTIANEARDRIREATVGKVERMVEDAGQTAQQTKTTLVDTIRQNPVPAAMAAMGIGWLAMRMRDSGGSTKTYRYDDYQRYGTGYGDMARRGYGNTGYDSGREYGNGGSDPLTQVRSVAGQAASSAQGVADQALNSAQQVGSDVQQGVQQVAQSAVETAQGTVQQAQWQFDRTLSQNPLALGALAVGVGAAVGLALPETQKERELYSQPREQLMGKVSEVASQALDQVETRAQEVGEQARSES
jgi:hypothetical protein